MCVLGGRGGGGSILNQSMTSMATSHYWHWTNAVIVSMYSTPVGYL